MDHFHQAMKLKLVIPNSSKVDSNNLISQQTCDTLSQRPIPRTLALKGEREDKSFETPGLSLDIPQNGQSTVIKSNNGERSRSKEHCDQDIGPAAASE
jgi:hypothetical protein